MERLDIVQRVIAWNAARFDRVFNYEMACKLLLEETEELYAAQSVVEKMDAVGDIVFVAIGVLWKLQIPEEYIQYIMYKEDLTKLNNVELHYYMNFISASVVDNLDHSQKGAWSGYSLATFSTFVTALGALRGLGMQDYFYDIVEAICNSNDTKEIKKTDPDKKANINKGEGFVPPSMALSKILADALNTKKMRLN